MLNFNYSLFRIRTIASKLCLFVSILTVLVSIPQQKAQACLMCTVLVAISDIPVWQASEDRFDQWINDEFLRLERFIVLNMWRDSILPILMLSAEQLTAVALQQVMIIGTFLDAKQQLETQQLFQVLQARAHKDYQPSEGMCQFGTVMKALAASDMRSEFTSFILSQRSQDRQMGNMQSSGAYGNDLDKDYRISQFKNKFCNEKDRGGALKGMSPNDALESLCTGMDWATMTPEQRAKINLDVDYVMTIDTPWTMRVNFTNQKILDTAATPPVHNEEEEDLFALSSNLFANELFPKPPAKSLEYVPEKPLTAMQQAFLDMRSIVAKRSVAENSFNAIAGAKSEGVMAIDSSGDPVNDAATGFQLPMRSRTFMESIIRNLGVNAAESVKLLGDNPSYNAQMEILTKKIFQSPDFYTNLYDTPTNVKRKAVTLQAIKMMQKFDMLKSFLRGEASFSVLLELSIVDLQKEIEQQIIKIDVSGG